MLGAAVLSTQAGAARAIAAAVAPVADGLSIVYSNAAEQPEAGPGHWVQVPSSAHFGPELQAAVALTKSGARRRRVGADPRRRRRRQRACGSQHDGDDVVSYHASGR